MKRILILSAMFFALGLTSIDARGQNYYVGEYFYTELVPYGRWIEIDYGVVVWKPTIMAVNWLPYRIGRWVWTYDGWYWDSYEPFGYITYHYGRWFYDDYYGWLWYPGYEWAPAWVEWRYSNEYIGWAPLHPYATFSISIGIHFTRVYHTPYHHWHFVSFNRFCHPYPYNYYVAPGHRYRVYSNTRYRTNYRYHNGRVQNRGVDINYVRVRSDREIRQRDIIRVRDKRELSRNGDNNQIKTLDLKRDNLERNDLKRMDIQRDNRRTNLDHSKIEVGRMKITRTNTRGERDVKQDGRKNVKITRDIKNQNVIKDVRNKDSNRENVKRNDVYNKNENRNRNNVTKRDVNTGVNNKVNKYSDRKNTVTRNQEVKKNNNNRFKTDVKKQNTRVKINNRNKQNQRTDVKIKRNNTQEKIKVNRNKPPVKRQNTNIKKNERKVQTNRTMVKGKNRERGKR